MGDGTDIGRVRGLGAAKGGTDHWIVQRYTAIGNMLLGLWLLASLVMLPSLELGPVRDWLVQPFVAVPMILLLVSVFAHLRVGLQVMIEDYVHDEGLKFAALLIVNFYALGGATLGIFSVAKLAFTGGSV